MSAELKADDRPDPTWDPRCGTMGATGYQAHLDRGERACEPCNHARWAASLVRRMRDNPPVQPSPDLPLEVWRPVADARGYVVSSEGRVRFTGSVLPTYHPPQDLKQWLDSDGDYLRVSIEGRYRKVHQLVAEAFHTNPRGYPLVRHLDGDPLHNVAANLAYGTYAENAADAQRHGTRATAQHGTKSKYSHGCRCEPCLIAQREYARARRADPATREADNAAKRARRAANRALEEQA
ncbi:NUMOD4 motif-containing HNH endonuclease [Curtobacterium sp. MCJR17_020]|uniref:NUMOD4 motif-containing HNH endonuclease n=1 Tax=Curtobacterium sp. MCJR17_020 TaxID=2175619 RepID=UPI001C6456D8|nr:NUMOD4 motif-containing HNH endonuclease [Curtobacterium sp. MCJR17_020]WIE70804.1 NUMOD4 motif-containing HNH endonuclease [Curtobacterium sp. MCJR17_020]